MIYWWHQYVKHSRKRGEKTGKKQRNGKKIQETKRHGDVASTEAGCIDTRRDTHHTNTHNMEGLFLTVRLVLLLCFLWVENYSGPYRFNDKLSKRQRVCRRAHKQTNKNVVRAIARIDKLRCKYRCAAPQLNDKLIAAKQRFHGFARGALFPPLTTDKTTKLVVKRQ